MCRGEWKAFKNSWGFFVVFTPSWKVVFELEGLNPSPPSPTYYDVSIIVRRSRKKSNIFLTKNDLVLRLKLMRALALQKMNWIWIRSLERRELIACQFPCCMDPLQLWKPRETYPRRPKASSSCQDQIKIPVAKCNNCNRYRWNQRCYHTNRRAFLSLQVTDAV